MPGIDIMSFDMASIIIESISRTFLIGSAEFPPDRNATPTECPSSRGRAHTQKQFTRSSHTLLSVPSTTSPSRSLVRFLATAAAAALLTAGGLAIAAPASAHDELVSTDPAADSTVDALPAQLTLTFSEAIDPTEGASEVQVTDAAGTTLVGSPAHRAGQRADPAARGDGIRNHHGAVEGRLERRTPRLGRVLVHRHRAGDPDPHAVRDGDADAHARRRPRSRRRRPRLLPRMTDDVERRLAVDHRRDRRRRGGRRDRLPARLAGASEARAGGAPRPGASPRRPIGLKHASLRRRHSRRGPRRVRRGRPKRSARPFRRGHRREVLGRCLPQRGLHPLQGSPQERRPRAHVQPQGRPVRHLGRRDVRLRRRVGPQPQGRRPARQGHPLPDEEEQGDRVRRPRLVRRREHHRRQEGRRLVRARHVRQRDHRDRLEGPAAAGRRARRQRRHVRGADPRPRPARVDRRRRRRRDRHGVRLRARQLRRQGHDHRVPRPRPADGGRGRLEGARPPVQEVRRRHPHLDQGRDRRRPRRPRHRDLHARRTAPRRRSTPTRS